MLPRETAHISRQKYIYAIQIEGTPFVKVGNAVDPIGRAALFQRGMRQRGILRVMLRVNVVSITAWTYEFALHAALCPYKVQGEWFYAPLPCIRQEMQRVIVVPHTAMIQQYEYAWGTVPLPVIEEGPFPGRAPQQLRLRLLSSHGRKRTGVPHA